VVGGELPRAEPPLTCQRFLQLATPEQLRRLKAGLVADAAVDGRGHPPPGVPGRAERDTITPPHPQLERIKDEKSLHYGQAARLVKVSQPNLFATGFGFRAGCAGYRIPGSQDRRIPRAFLIPVPQRAQHAARGTGGRAKAPGKET